MHWLDGKYNPGTLQTRTTRQIKVDDVRAGCCSKLSQIKIRIVFPTDLQKHCMISEQVHNPSHNHIHIECFSVVDVHPQRFVVPSGALKTMCACVWNMGDRFEPLVVLHASKQNNTKQATQQK